MVAIWIASVSKQKMNRTDYKKSIKLLFLNYLLGNPNYSNSNYLGNSNYSKFTVGFDGSTRYKSRQSWFHLCSTDDHIF